MIFADTAYFIALLKPGDHLHQRARAWEAAVESQQLVVTEFVLTELLNALHRRRDRSKAAAAVDWLRMDSRHEVVPASSLRFSQGLTLFRDRHDKQWSHTDCISFRIMHERHITGVLSDDHHFEQAGFDTLLARDP